MHENLAMQASVSIGLQPTEILMKSFLLNSQQTAQSTVVHFCLPSASFDKIGQPLQVMEDKINSPTKCTASQPHGGTMNGDFCYTLVTYEGDCPQFEWTMF